VRCLNDADYDDGGDGGLRWMDKVGAMGSTLVNALISVGRLTDDHESRPSSARRTYCPAAEGSANRRQIAGDTIFNRPTFVESDDFRSSSLQDFFLSDPFQKFGTAVVASKISRFLTAVTASKGLRAYFDLVSFCR